jgi:cytochrome c oxidase subunit II
VTSETDTMPAEPVRPPLRERMRTPGGRLVVSVGIVFLVMTVILLIFGVWWPLASMPSSASDTMDAVRQTMLVFSIAAAPVMAIVWAIAYYSLRHWQHGGETPPEDGPPIRGNNRIVLSWVIVSSLLTAFLLIWGLAALSSTTADASAASPLVVKVTGQQWLWSFSYPQDGGISSSDLMLPVDRPVVFQVTSTDVIHSFWLPEMGIKVDANPAVTTQVSTTPDQIGRFNVRCAELCGLNHSYMQTSAHVMSADDFAAWVRSEGGISGQTATEAGSG